MDIQKVSAWAGIGSFLVGVAMLCLAWVQLHPESAAASRAGRWSIPLGMWIFLGVLLIAACLNFTAARTSSRGGATEKTSKHAQLPETQLSEIKDPYPQPGAGRRAFLGPEVTPQYLMDIFEGKTSIQAERLTQIYVGKWMRVTGIVSNVGRFTPPIGSAVQVTVSIGIEGEELRHVSLWFRQEWEDHVSTLSIGRKITATGKVKDIHNFAVQLEECQLEDV